MSSVHASCPQCGGLDLEVPQLVGGTASCPICRWSGPMSDTIGLATTEAVYDSNRVGEILIRVASKYVVAPLIQATEVIGLIPKKETSEVAGWAEEIDIIRDRLVHRILEGLIPLIFESCMLAHQEAKTFLTRRHPQEAAKVYPSVPGTDERSKRNPG